MTNEDRAAYDALGRLRARIEHEPTETLRDQCLRIFRDLDAKRAARDQAEYNNAETQSALIGN